MLGDAFQAVVDAWASAMGRVAIAGTMVLLVAGWAERRIGARSPRARSWIWRFAWIQLVLLMVPGSGRLQLPESWRPPQDWDWVVPGRTEVAARGVPRPSDRIGVTASSLGVPPSAIPGEDPLGEGGMPRPPESWGATTAAFVVWLVLALGWVALLGWQRGTALRWIARSEPAKDPRLGAWIAEWKEELRRRIRSAGSRRMLDRLEVRVHPDVCSPRVAGVWRPTILLPTDGGVLGTEEAARAVLTHEWGHVVRGDLAWRWLRGWIRAALFFHPLVAWAERRTLVAEEMACDRMAMDGGKLSPAAFGKLLVRLAEAERSVARSRRMGLAAGMSRQAAGLLERMHGLASVEGRSSRRRLMMVGAWVVLMGVLGWVSLGGRQGIRQRDARFPVAGFHVSRGTGHTLRLSRESLQVLGMDLRRVQASTRAGQVSFDPGLPSRLAGWLSAVGIRPDLRSDNVAMGFGDGTDGYAFFVRFRGGSHPPAQSPERLRAELVDEAGETVPLVAHDPPSVPPTVFGDEVIRAWTLAPAPRTPGRFDLRLVVEDEETEAATLRLGILGGHE